MKIKNVFNKPKIIAIVGDADEAKSNLLYNLIDRLKQIGDFNLYTYGLKYTISGATQIYSVDELEQIRDSVIFLDEVMDLFNLDDRKEKKKIERTFRLIFHNNNILVLSCLPENLKKFICGKVNQYFFKKCTIGDFINGSGAKKVCTNYRGIEAGSSILNIRKEEAIFFDGLHYEKINVPYMKKYDSKKENKNIIRYKNAGKNVHKNAHENVEKVFNIKNVEKNENEDSE